MDKKKKKFVRTLEDRDREDQLLFGWKGGVARYSKQLDLDSYLDTEDDEKSEE